MGHTSRWFEANAKVTEFEEREKNIPRELDEISAYLSETEVQTSELDTPRRNSALANTASLRQMQSEKELALANIRDTLLPAARAKLARVEEEEVAQGQIEADDAAIESQLRLITEDVVSVIVRLDQVQALRDRVALVHAKYPNLHGPTPAVIYVDHIRRYLEGILLCRLEALEMIAVEARGEADNAQFEMLRTFFGR